MKLIDIVNKIANNEEVPLKIILKGIEYEYGKEAKDYYFIDVNGSRCYLFNDCFWTHSLNEEIEIIEDTPKEIEKIQNNTGVDENLTPIQIRKNIAKNFSIIIDVTNEIIDKVNYLLKKDKEGE